MVVPALRLSSTNGLKTGSRNPFLVFFAPCISIELIVAGCRRLSRSYVVETGMLVGDLSKYLTQSKATAQSLPRLSFAARPLPPALLQLAPCYAPLAGGHRYLV